MQQLTSPIVEKGQFQDREAWLRLAFVGLSANRCRQAIQVWGSPEELLVSATSGREEDLLGVPGLTPKAVERIRKAARMDLEPVFAAMERFSIRMLCQEDIDYPQTLKTIPDPPLYLFARGEVRASDAVAVGIVGTRHATEYGRGLAGRLAGDLARRGVTVVSGLARGIDTAAHRGAIEAGGRTFAVCGCGLDITYPQENGPLMAEIQHNGANLSEFAPTVHPESWHFPARNRIISGLSAGIIVVEAGERSGALITSDFAIEQSRDVFAVPGNVHKAQSRGCHNLIKQGATLIESADDVLEALNNRALPFGESVVAMDKNGQGELFRPAAARLEVAPRNDLSAEQNKLWLVLETEPRHVDILATDSEMSAAQANAALVLFELKGLARRHPGNTFSRVG